MFDSFFNYIFHPLFALPDIWAVLIISIIMSCIITIAYKFLTNQKLMKTLKDELKELQAEIKTLKDQPEKMMEVNKRLMETNMKYMSHSLKPTLFTFLPLILIFGFLSAHFSYAPLAADTQFSSIITFQKDITGAVKLIAEDGITFTGATEQNISNSQLIFNLKATSGEHNFKFSLNGKEYSAPFVIGGTTTKDLKIDDNQVYTISFDLKKNVLINLFGWQMGWLWVYFLTSVIVSMSLRKIFNIY